jgi:hypothetical protein
MMGRQDRDQGQLFYEFNLDEVIPKEHLLRRMNVFVTGVLANVHQQLMPFYSDIGRPSVDPELMIWMLIVGYCCPIVASATVAAIGNGAAFARGRDFAAWLGLVPKQMSTGDRTILGRITKRGNRYLRMLFVQGARAILLRPKSWVKHSFGPWLTTAARRLHRNILTIALANKLARIALSVLIQGRSYETRIVPAAA